MSLMYEAFIHVYEHNLFFLLQGRCLVHICEKATDAGLPLFVHQRDFPTISPAPIGKSGYVPFYHKI